MAQGGAHVGHVRTRSRGAPASAPAAEMRWISPESGSGQPFGARPVVFERPLRRASHVGDRTSGGGRQGRQRRAVAAATYGPGGGVATGCLRARLVGGRDLQRTLSTLERSGGAAAAWEHGAGSTGGNQRAAKAAGDRQRELLDQGGSLRGYNVSGIKGGRSNKKSAHIRCARFGQWKMKVPVSL